MFCAQCEQTRRTGPVPGCTDHRGACGKQPETSDLQDLLVHATQGVAQYAVRCRELGRTDREVTAFVLEAMFATLTNVNFDDDRIVAMIRQAAQLRDRLRDRYLATAEDEDITPDVPSGPADWSPASDLDGLFLQAPVASQLTGQDLLGPDIIGIRQLLLSGVKGLCAYAHHARVLGDLPEEVEAGVEEILAYLADGPTDPEEMHDRGLDIGRLNLTVMEILDTAHVGRFGSPTPTEVTTSPVAGKAILVSGHDLADLEQILIQTRGTGINVYTHGEMLPAHGYPGFAAYPHLVGNYGGAWQDQRTEFLDFPGAIIMTSNCLIEPRRGYQDRTFTLGPVGWPGVRHLEIGDIGPAIEAALAQPGFAQDAPRTSLLVGFAHDAVLSVADTVIDAVKTGDIRHFFLVGGCDGAMPGRNYYTEFARAAPDDTVLLTLGCAKYRFNSLDFGTVAGLPRLLDIGQCNDSYSAVQIALALAKAFDCGVNDLPLSLVISWFEQKAVAVLLSLLALGVRGISLGPTLPGYLTPALLEILTDRFDIRTIGDVEEDIAAALAG
jgi:hydroxylamine reductase